MALFDIIKYEGDNNTFVWKHPREDFNTWSQLIIHESQEAIFFMNGQALDTFGPGRYTLETQNIPILRRILNIPTGGKTPFHCEVYFINKTVQMAVKWGTDSKVRYIDPESGVPLELGASGELNLQVTDGRKLLTKLIGTMNGVAWGDTGNGFAKSLNSSFRPLIVTAVKSNLTSAIKTQNVNILEVDEHLDELSSVLHQKIAKGFDEYGLGIPEFYLTTIVLPENDPNFKKIRELHTIALQTRMAQAEADITAARRQIELEHQTTQTEISKREAERKMIEAEATAHAMKLAGLSEAEVMAAKGYTQRDVLQAEVQKAYAEGIGNMKFEGGSSGGTMGDIMGLGVGMAAAQAIVPQMGKMIQGMGVGTVDEAPPIPENKKICVKCGSILPENAKFCLECGGKVVVLEQNEIICPNCGKKTLQGKFCMECGNALVKKCPACGAELPPNGKFCLECGKKVE